MSAQLRTMLSRGLELGMLALAVALVATLLSGRDDGALAGLERPALGGTVSTVEDLTILTGESSGEDIVYVLDNSAQRVMVYRLANPERVEYLASLSLQRVFIEGRQRYGAGGR